MEGCKIRSTLIFLVFALILKIGNALPVDSNKNEPSILATSTNKDIPDISELVKIQAETIKKILSVSQAASEQDKKSQKNCDEIETGIKETLTKSTETEEKDVEKEVNDQDVEKEVNDQVVEKEVNDQEAESAEISIRENDRRGDLESESSVTEESMEEAASEKSVLPNGRTLFTYYPTVKKPDVEVKNVTTSTVTTVTEESRTHTERPNFILIPCMKKLVTDGSQSLSEDPTRRLYNHVNSLTQSQNQNLQIHLNTDKPITIATANPDPAQTLALEKIYSPSGQFLYYMYRLRNANPVTEVISTTVPPTTTKETTTKSSTTTTSTTSTTTTKKPIPEPVYTEQMKFIVRAPLTDPEPLSRYPWRFDKFAYYPKDMQPSYINAPVPYSPMYQMIQTLAIPTDDDQYVLKDPVNPTLENKK